MVDKVALAKAGLKFAAGRKSKDSKKGDKTKTPKPGDNPFYYVDVVYDKHGHPKLDAKNRPVTKERRKDRNYYVNKLGIPEADAEILLKMKNRAMLMDGGRKIIGIKTPLGLSTVLTFCVPEIGDGIDGLISYAMVVRAGKISGGLGARNHAAMTLNVGRDFAIGAIPFAGALIDMFYRANTRNSNMLEKILIERAQKAHLHSNDSYESSLYDSDTDVHVVRADQATTPQKTAKQPHRTDTHQSRHNQQAAHSTRRVKESVAPEIPKAQRTNTAGSKKTSKSSRKQAQDAQFSQAASKDLNRVETGRSTAPQSGRFVNLRDL